MISVCIFFGRGGGGVGVCGDGKIRVGGEVEGTFFFFNWLWWWRRFSRLARITHCGDSVAHDTQRDCQACKSESAVLSSVAIRSGLGQDATSRLLSHSGAGFQSPFQQMQVQETAL